MKKSLSILSIILLLAGCSSSKDSVVNDAKQIENEKLEATLNIPAENFNFKAYLPTFMFHYIKNVPSDSPDQVGYKLSFSPEKLEQFLSFFQENNIKTLTFWDLKNILENKKELPEKAVILTFDDGHIDHYHNAFQILKKYNMRGVFFIIVNKPDQDQNYATWDQIQEMSQNGQEIASHTMSHLNLTNLSEAEIKYELERSKEIIEEKIGRPVISFCYPAGKYDERVLKTAKENYLFARTTNPGKDFSVLERYQIPTVRIFPTTGIASLKIWFEVK